MSSSVKYRADTQRVRAPYLPGELRLCQLQLTRRLVKKYNLNFISTGDVLRHEIGAKTELGRKVESIVAEGGGSPLPSLVTSKSGADGAGLVPDELMVELVQKELDRHRGEVRPHIERADQ